MKKRYFIPLLLICALLFFFYLQEKSPQLENKSQDLSTINFQKEKKTIRGHSMEPLLKDGEEVLTLFGYYQDNPLARNDLVIISFKTQPGKFFVKKLVGLPDDKIEIKENKIYLNGELLKNSLDEVYLVTEKGANLLLKPLINQQIADGYYLVLSETTNPSSFDSRYFGYLEKTHILGKVIK